MSAQSSYRDAVLDDGCYVLGKVVAILYRGENLRPDIYFRRDRHLCRKNYNGIFSGEQRQRIQESGSPDAYDIGSGARHFDVSLFANLAEHTCGLNAGDPLLKRIIELRDLRNKICHPSEAVNSSFVVNEGNLTAKLQELLSLYVNIIEGLEMKTGNDMSSYQLQIQDKISQRLPQAQGTHTGQSRPMGAHNGHGSREMASEEMPAWGKMALGVTAGVAVVGIAGALAWGASARGEKKEESKKKRAEKQEPEDWVFL